MGAQVSGLHFEVVKGDLEALRNYIIVEKGDVHRGCKSDGDWTFMHDACREGWMHIVQYLVEAAKADINLKRGGFQETPLLVACREGRLEIVKYLAEHGGDFSLQNVFGVSPLSHAALRLFSSEATSQVPSDFCGLTKFLLEDIGLKFDNKYAIHEAVVTALSNNDLELAKYEIDKFKLDPSEKIWGCGLNLLHSVCKDTLTIEVIKFLTTECKCLINDKTTFTNDTALNLLLKHQQSEFVKILVEEYGADPTIPNNAGCNSFLMSCAKGSCSIEAFDFFLQQNPSFVHSKNFIGNSALHILVICHKLSSDLNFENQATRLVESGLDPDSKNLLGSTSLHLAAQLGFYHGVQILLKLGCSAHLVNQFGLTPVDTALAEGFSFIADEMRKFVADKSEGKKSLGQACCKEFKGKFELQTFLEKCAPEMASDDSVSLGNTNFISVTFFLESGRFPHFDEVTLKNNHVLGSWIPKEAKILFISHRWGSSNHPDPTNLQYEYVKKFLERKKEKIDFIWLDYACICQDTSSALYKVHLQNIPTALFTSTHMIVVPAQKEIFIAQSVSYNWYLSCPDNQDYFSRAWCQFELLIAMMSKTEVSIYQSTTASKKSVFKDMLQSCWGPCFCFGLNGDPIAPTATEEDELSMGFSNFLPSSSTGEEVASICPIDIEICTDELGIQKSLRDPFPLDHIFSFMLNEKTGGIYEETLFSFKEPLELLSALLQFVSELYARDRNAFNLAVRCVDFKLTNLVQTSNGQWSKSIEEIFSLLGGCEKEEDKEIILCLLLGCVSYFVKPTQSTGAGKLFSTQDEHVSNKEETPKVRSNYCGCSAQSCIIM